MRICIPAGPSPARTCGRSRKGGADGVAPATRTSRISAVNGNKRYRTEPTLAGRPKNDARLPDTSCADHRGRRRIAVAIRATSATARTSAERRRRLKEILLRTGGSLHDHEQGSRLDGLALARVDLDHPAGARGAQ